MIAKKKSVLSVLAILIVFYSGDAQAGNEGKGAVFIFCGIVPVTGVFVGMNYANNQNVGTMQLLVYAAAGGALFGVPCATFIASTEPPEKDYYYVENDRDSDYPFTRNLPGKENEIENDPRFHIIKFVYHF